MQLGLEPEIVKELIHKVFYEFGPDNFVEVSQDALYVLMYYGTARFEEVKELKLLRFKSVKENETKHTSSNSVSYTPIL